eukprot:493542-Pyramimonas_sp.AAC.1
MNHRDVVSGGGDQGLGSALIESVALGGVVQVGEGGRFLPRWSACPVALSTSSSVNGASDGPLLCCCSCAVLSTSIAWGRLSALASM